MLRDVVQEMNAENDKLRLLIQRLVRHQFGRRSEQLSAEQLQLGLEDLEQTVAANQAAQETVVSEPKQPTTRARPQRNLGDLPAHLPRYEVLVDVERRECPCCGGALHVIGEDRSEQLDVVPAQLRVRVTRRPRYACRACEQGVVQAPAPERPIDGGLATEAMVAHVLISKYCDSLPLYRQSKMLARQDIALDRSTLSNWVGRACWWLTPLYDLVVSTALSSDKLFADDTTLPVLDPGRGKTKLGRLWCYAVDDRPWRGPGHPVAAYVYSEDRKAMRPAAHLAGFRGVLQVDGYSGFKRLAGDRTDDSVRLAFCWAHLRRPFYQFFEFDEVAACRPLAGAHPRALCDRGGDLRVSGQTSTRGAASSKSADRGSAAGLAARAASACLGGLRSREGDALRAPSLAGTGRVPRRRADRNGHERCRARHPSAYSNQKERTIRGQRRRRASLGDCNDTHSDGEAERCRADGLADRRPRAGRLRADQSTRIGHASAVELAAEQVRTRPPYHSNGGIGPMIDRPDQVERLMERLSAALPVPARVTPEVQLALKKERGVAMPPNCSVTWISYAGDEGGIVCRVETDIAKSEAVFASITHLRFDPRLPLSREIIAYQKHRVKRLRRQGS